MARVLLVEDDPEVRRNVIGALTTANEKLNAELALRGLSYRVLSRTDIDDDATDAATAIEKLEDEDDGYDLILLDLHLPRKPGDKAPDAAVLHGFDVLTAIRGSSVHSATPVVLLSVNVDATRPARRLGLDAHYRTLDERHIEPADELLLKEFVTLEEGMAGGYGGDDPDRLQRKLAAYLVDLSGEDEQRLTQAGIRIPRRGRKTRDVLRQLKRYACSSLPGRPRPDVLLLGENGVGKSTFAKAYHLFRPRPSTLPCLGFEHLDLGSIDFAGSAPNLALFGATEFNGQWSLGAFVKSTLYRRKPSHNAGNDTPTLFKGQMPEIRVKDDPDGKKTRELKDEYPLETDVPDFDGSGTLFLDEVVNVSPDIQAMLLQALGYNLWDRHVRTTGTQQRRLRVGPSLVMATARRFEGDRESGPGGVESTWRGMLDYRFRIDQRRVRIPPLRERREEIVELLQWKVEARTGRRSIPVEPNILEMLMRRLEFRNNIADIERIADLVEPEEPSISWRHVRDLHLRERPPETIDVKSPGWNRSQCAKHLKSIDDGAPPRGLADLKQESERTAYRVGLLVVERGGGAGWPSEEVTKRYCGQKKRSFEAEMRRLKERFMKLDNDDQAYSFAKEDVLSDMRNFVD